MDEDDKIRRNLVMASSFVLLSEWLQIPFSAWIGKLIDFGALKSPPDDLHLLAVGLCVLAYLAARYSFSKEGACYRGDIADEFKSQQVSKSLLLVQKQANAFTKNGSVPCVFDQGFLRVIKEISDQLEGRISGRHFIRPEILISICEKRKTPWSFSVYLDMRWSLESGFNAFNNPIVIEVLILSRDQWFINISSRLHTLCYTKTSINYAFPVYFCALAIGVLFYKIVSNLI